MPESGTQETARWWRSAVIYQVYPRSFQDSNGDGVGDLPGITAQLDYLADLGIDAIWLSPIYPSPMADFGYDVADYLAIDPVFGTLDDFAALIEGAHARGLRVLMDFVPNHSSDKHPWFVESRSSRDSPKRDWYLWADPAGGGGPPNNWISDFGGPAWTFDILTGQYYAHAFLPEQPDLNWRNPDVRAAMLGVMDAWFARGVDGFRIDVLWHVVKAAGFPDNPPNPDWQPGMAEMFRVHQTHSTDQPEALGVAADMRRVADAHGDRLLVGEIYLPFDRLMAYHGTADVPGVHLPFNFALLDTPWDAGAVAVLIRQYEAALPPGAWPNWVLGNHDRPRVASRWGPERARAAMLLLLTLRGTPTLYYGDELGMADVPIPPDRVRDPRELREPDLGLGRDPVRTPMAWGPGPNAEFTGGEPWLPLHTDWPTRNVAVQSADAASMLTFTRAALALRRATPALALGEIADVRAEGDVLTYTRALGGERLGVAINFADAERRVALPGPATLLLLSTHDARGADESGAILLRAAEGAVFALA